MFFLFVPMAKLRSSLNDLLRTVEDEKRLMTVQPIKVVIGLIVLRFLPL